MTSDTPSNPAPSSVDILTVLQSLHASLAAGVAPLGAEDVVRPAFPSEWSIAQVMSHLGSGAEIFSLFLASGRSGEAAPEFEEFSRIWDIWNAKKPQDQTEEALTSDAAFLDQLASMSDAERAQFSVAMFNGDQDLTGFLRLRLGELAVHTWDVLVALDPSATLDFDATALLLPGLGELVGRAGERSDDEVAVRITTVDPAADFVLSLGPDGPQLTDADASTPASGTLSLPAEALVRLVYGRLDPDHTPAVRADGVDLEQLRKAFPGF